MSGVIVTGAAGFIGSHVCDRLLSTGTRVLGLDSFTVGYDEAIKRRNIEAASGDARFQLVEGDIRDAALVDGLFERFRPDAVVHLAALAGVRHSVEEPARFADVNVRGTAVLLESAARHGLGRFIFGSSSSVYGNNEHVPFAEDDPVNDPISPYAATKRAGELLAHTFHHVHGISVTCLRFFTVYGPRQRPDLAIGMFMRLIAEGRPVRVFGDGSMQRDFTYIDDILAGITAALDRRAGFRIYNLGSGKPVTISELIAAIERVTGMAATIEHHDLQPGDVRRTWANLARAAVELDYAPATALDDGLAGQWAWLRESWARPGPV